MIRALAAAVRLRACTTEQLIAHTEHPLRRTNHRRPPITALRLAYRLASGYTPPFKENAAIVAALRAGGWPARLALGADPVPDHSGRRHLHAWIELDDQPIATSLPAHTYLADLTRFPPT
ncbi:hypothetical protein E2651_33310 [Streptomyces sp. MZ04]|nr:hypothetical protein E2651_33310 [Streptomyces sp. MZ04]